MVKTTPLSVRDNVTKSHLDKPNRLRSTVAANSPATILIIPQDNLRVQFLRHGSLFTKGLGTDPDSIFVAGNRMSAPIKIMDVNKAVRVIGTAGILASTCNIPIQTPDNDEIFCVVFPKLNSSPP
jgi:hypothetical protein